jgi:hypothetical protein
MEKFWIQDPKWKKFGSGIRDGKNSDPESKKFGSGIKHPGFAKHWKFRQHLTSTQGWAKLVLIALERYSVALKRLTFNLR